jgi:hypothetical protein
LIESKNEIKLIFINPGHRPTMSGKFVGCKGNELDIILKEYFEEYKDKNELNLLKKVINLYEENPDLLQLAHNLKIHYPDEKISIFNASDPDVNNL